MKRVLNLMYAYLTVMHLLQKYFLARITAGLKRNLN